MSIVSAMRRTGAACVLAIGAICGQMAFDPASAAAEMLDDIVKTGVIKIAVPHDFPPYGFVGTDLKPQGLTSTWPS